MSNRPDGKSKITVHVDRGPVDHLVIIPRDHFTDPELPLFVAGVLAVIYAEPETTRSQLMARADGDAAAVDQAVALLTQLGHIRYVETGNDHSEVQGGRS